MTAFSPQVVADLIKTFKVDGSSLYIVGTFDTGVTVFSQQTRAFNLVWAAIESELVPATSKVDPATISARKKIAVVGAGFAGLSVAAGLLAKDADAEITLFEQRDTLLPLQQGSDSRWLHPRIYDWPRAGSEASVAMLPLLNWTAARASDVVVQVLDQWRRVVERVEQDRVMLYCNARHLQIHETENKGDCLRIEWVGESRDPNDGTARAGHSSAATGMSEDFDHVILAIGFGLERDGALSYWRNETVGQPSLDEPKRTYLISGQGDGAMIDLLRIRISQYRQDRIIDEVFSTRETLLAKVSNLYEQHLQAVQKTGLFADFERLASDSTISLEFKAALDVFRRRLRRDTDAILRLNVKKLSELFDPAITRISFQNKLLVYLLYKCGGFVPSTHKESKLVKQHGIPEGRIIRRHGTFRDEHLKDILSESLYEAIEKRRDSKSPDPFLQSDKPRWPGGYFDIPGPSKSTDLVEETLRGHWRKEYLPGPTELLATAFCSALAGVLVKRHEKNGRLRVTLHRSILFGSEELLQQACDYQGTDNARSLELAAGRTFPAHNGTIGQAYEYRKIVRSVKDVKSDQLNEAMKSLRLHEASRAMSTEVVFVLAIPLLAGKDSSTVLGVIYIDSTAFGFFICNEELKELVKMAQTFLSALLRTSVSTIERIRNIHLMDRSGGLQNSTLPSNGVRNPLELIESVEPPKLEVALQFNFDFSDLPPIRT